MEQKILALRAFIERFGPIVLATLGFILVFFLLPIKDLISFIAESETSILSVSITLGGFLLTIYTIINSIENRITKALKQADSFKLLVDYLNKALRSNFILAFFVFIVILIRTTKLSFAQLDPNIYKGLASFYISYFLFTAFRTTRIIYLMTRLLGYKK